MTDNTTPDIPLGSWLADLPDERLIRLLELRPDLAQPPPGSIAALAARAQARQSVKAATDDLDFLRLAVLDALLVLQADATPVPTTKLLALIGDRAPEADVVGALDDLKQRALAWGETARAGGRRCRRGVAVASGAGHARGRCAHRRTDRRSDRRAQPGPARRAGEVARRLPDGAYPRRRARRPAGPAGAATAGDGPAATGRRGDGDLAPPRRAGAARRAARPDAADGARPDRIDHDGRGLRRRRGRSRHRPAARTRRAAREPRRRTGFRAAQRRIGRSRSQAAGQDHRHRRAAAGPDPRGRGRGRADRQRHARSGTGHRRRTILGADGGRRPVHRDAARRAMAPAGQHLARPAGPARADRQPRSGRQTLWRAVGFAVLDGGAAGSPAAAGHARRAARRRGRRRDLGVGGADLAASALGQATAAGTRRGSAGRGTRAGSGRSRGDQHARPRAAGASRRTPTRRSTR